MARMMQLKAFEPAQGAETARMSSTASKTYAAMALALRPCGVTAYEAAESINAIGGQPYTPAYVKSAQFAGSYYGPLGYGAYGVVETVGDHVAAVRGDSGLYDGVGTGRRRVRLRLSRWIGTRTETNQRDDEQRRQRAREDIWHGMGDVVRGEAKRTVCRINDV